MASTDASLLMRVPLKPSPSLVSNNLCTVGGSGLAYIHTRSAALVPSLPLAGAASGTSTATIEAGKIDIQDYSLVQAVASCVVDGTTLLALGNEAGLQVWDGAGESLLFVWQLPRSEVPSTQHTDFVRGLAFNMAADRSVQLCAGCSNSSIHVFSVAPGMHFKHATSLAHGAQPIAALASAFHSRRGGWADDLGSELVSCDDEGIIRVWQAQSSSSYADMGLRISITAGVPCCSVAVRRGFIVAGCTDGCVRIFSLKDGQLRHEIVAHSRWLSALDIHPSRDLIVTVAQDCTLAVWQLPIAMSKAACLLSVCSLHDVLTGVAFCGDASDDIAAVAYDVEALLVLPAGSIGRGH